MKSRMTLVATVLGGMFLTGCDKQEAGKQVYFRQDGGVTQVTHHQVPSTGATHYQTERFANRQAWKEAQPVSIEQAAGQIGLAILFGVLDSCRKDNGK